MTAPLSQAQWEEIRRASMDAVPALVEDAGLPSVLLSYQGSAVARLEAGTAVLIIEKSRRIGMTWGLASYAALRAARAKSAGGMDAMYISYSQEMTREFVDACAMWARAYALAAADVQEFLFDDTDPKTPDETRQIQAFRIRFASGFEVLALSSAPRTLRGKQGLVIIDEAAFVDSLAELLKAALAFLMWGGQVVVCSTHNGTDNPFNQIVQETLAKTKPYAHMKVDFDQALLDGLYQRICLVTGRDWSVTGEAAWRQEIVDFYGDGADEELFCIPTQGSGAWLTTPLIEARMTLPAEAAPVMRLELPTDYLQRPPLARQQLLVPFMEELNEALRDVDPEALHAFGYDPARRNDPAIAQLLRIEKDLRRVSALTVEMRGVPFAEQKAVCREIMLAVRLVGAAFDATGMGMNLAEDIGREFGIREEIEGAGLVWMIMLSTAWYNEHMPPLKAAFEQDTIALAKDAAHVVDLRLVKIIRGVPSIPAEKADDPAGGKLKRHGDFAVALALAHFASRMEWREFAYIRVTPTPSRFEEASGPDGSYLDPSRHAGNFRMSSLRRSRGAI